MSGVLPLLTLPTEGPCLFCETPTRRIVVARGVPARVCEACDDELARGIVRNPGPLNLANGSHRLPDDDPGPWQENAIRAMEDDQ